MSGSTTFTIIIQHSNARGLSVGAYNAIRIASVFYLFAIIYGTGSFVLRAIFSNEFLSLGPTKIGYPLDGRQHRVAYLAGTRDCSVRF